MRRPSLEVLWLLLLMVGSSVWCLTAAPHLGPTFDESLYVRLGLTRWHTGSTAKHMADGVMPLPSDVQTLPLYLWERSRGERLDLVADSALATRIARAGSLPFWWLLLGYVFRWGRLLGGPWAGGLAAGLLATDPSFLAHATLAATDIAAVATVLVSGYHFATNRDRGWGWRVVWPGFLYGVAMSAKASALAHVPILFGLMGLSHLAGQGKLAAWHGGAWRTARTWWVVTSRLRWDMTYAFFVGFAWVLWYTGSDWKPEPQFAAWAPTLEPGTLRDVLVWLANRGAACFPNAAEGMARQMAHAFHGHVHAVVYGQVYDPSVWYYFPVTLAIKLPDATLLALAVVPLLRRRGAANPAAPVVLVLLLFSLTMKVQIGIRLVLPLVAFLALWLAATATRPIPAAQPDRRRWAVAVLVVAIGYSGLEAVRVWPDGLRYANQLHGGPDAGARLMADSNYDWGQGLPELREWWEVNGQPPLLAWFFGTDPQMKRQPFPCVRMHDWPDPSAAELRRRVGDGYFAVTVTFLLCSGDTRPVAQETAAWLRSLTPVARTRTALIYRFTGP